MIRRHGFTLLELAIIFAVLTVLCVSALPAFTNARRVLAIRAARADVIAAISATRAHAVLVGGAQLVVTPDGELRIERGDGRAVGEAVHLGARYGVLIATPRNVPVVLRYDALGIGRMTNTTLRLHRGDVTATITVSAYGRARS
jgi:type II secretory pathway pseudopilin PulG